MAQDANLICYFSWGRREYIEKTFPELLKSKRPQDRLLVLDQEMHNIDFYTNYKDQIDYLIFTNKNYRIGPAWNLFKNITNWLKENNHGDVRWYPDFINIVESDALCEVGFIDKLVPLIKGKIVVASGYLASKDPNTKILRRDGEVYIKEGTQGVNVIVRTEEFLKVKDYPNYTQDLYFQNHISNKEVACLPIVKHIGSEKPKSKGFFR